MHEQHRSRIQILKPPYAQHTIHLNTYIHNNHSLRDKIIFTLMVNRAQASPAAIGGLNFENNYNTAAISFQWFFDTFGTGVSGVVFARCYKGNDARLRRYLS